MSPIVPVAIVLAAAGGLAFVKLRQGSSLPPDLQASFDQLLSQGRDPDALEAVAVKLDGLGFHREAAQLRAKEALLRGGAPATQPLLNQTDPSRQVLNQTSPDRPAPSPAPAPAPAPAPSPGPSLPAQFMKVTTHDPAPGGDLALRSAPSDSASVIGAAEKDSVVTVKGVSPDGRFVNVEALNPAGRRQSVTGWGHAAFLVPTNPMSSSGRRAALVGAARVLCAGARAPLFATMVCAERTGCLVRPVPTYAVGTLGVVPCGAVVDVFARVPGPDGGFSCVRTRGAGALSGWVPTKALRAVKGEAA